jgi:hypothetical protein
MVDKDSGERLSPYYPPQPRLLREVWQAWELDAPAFGAEDRAACRFPTRVAAAHSFDAKASRPSVVPQAYVSYPVAKHACENGRTLRERMGPLPAKGEAQTAGNLERTNAASGVVHPGVVLHQASFGHRDPRLNLVATDGSRRSSGAQTIDVPEHQAGD